MIFDAATLAQLRKTQEATMMHECTIEAYDVDHEGRVSYGEDAEAAYGEPVTSICGFKTVTYAAHTSGAMYESVQADGEMRFPLGVTIGMNDRITLTKSFGAELDPVRRFEVVGLPDSFGPSGQVVKVREIYV